MRPGLDEDDRWVMVEDEFLTTAKLFTAHLHHADYQLLKKLSGARGASTLSTISRATDGHTKQSTLTRKMVEANALRKSTKIGVRNVVGSGTDDDDDDLDEDPYMDDPTLAGLMNKSQDSVKLGKLVRSQERVNSVPDRGKKRYDRLRNNSETDDDLDSLRKPNFQRPPKSVTTAHTLEKSRYKSLSTFRQQTRDEERVVPLDRNLSKSTASRSTTEAEQQSTSLPESVYRTSAPPSLDEYRSLSRRSALPPRLLAKMNQRRAAENNQTKDLEEEENKKSTSRLSDVPVFLL
jgi:hypothetical protein